MENHDAKKIDLTPTFPTYKSPARPSLGEELEGTGPLSEFERGLKELGVEMIHANFPHVTV